MIKLIDHPAARAWRTLRPDRAEPTRVTVLSDRGKAAVYRLEGAGAGGSPIIAKHCLTSIGDIERCVYEDILPRLPVATLGYYGSVADDEASRWLFLEPADGRRFSPMLENDRVLCAQWLAAMHIAAADLNAAARLPDRGPTHYLDHLRSARETLRRRLGDPALRGAEHDSFSMIVRQCDVIESHWKEMEEECSGLQPTLVHGDFRPKNVQLRGNMPGARVLVMDWETAGWGVPAADIASLRGPQGELAALMAYLTIARRSWRNLRLNSMRQMVEVGKLFRRLAAINWCSSSLTSRPEKALATMKVHQAQLTLMIQDRRWVQ